MGHIVEERTDHVFARDQRDAQSKLIQVCRIDTRTKQRRGVEIDLQLPRVNDGHATVEFCAAINERFEEIFLECQALDRINARKAHVHHTILGLKFL